MNQFLHHPSEALQQHALLILIYFSEGNQENYIKTFSIRGIIPKIVVELINSDDEKVALYAVVVASNLAKGNKDVTPVN